MNSSPAPEPPRKPKKKLTAALVTAAQVALVLAILWLIWGKLSKAVEQIRSSDFQFTLQWGWIALGGLFYCISLLFPPMYWHSVLRQLGQTPTFYASMRAHIIGHLGKYIPGKIFVVLIRSGLLRGPGVDTTVCVLSIFLEGLLQMAV
ncbi:MAG: flippase-like domain-containing protein, partial [Thermoguttaceae bacterium]|nr:flippase-like domain-containing protein [Thermoguttaceae bacterium]